MFRGTARVDNAYAGRDPSLSEADVRIITRTSIEAIVARRSGLSGITGRPAASKYRKVRPTTLAANSLAGAQEGLAGFSVFVAVVRRTVFVALSQKSATASSSEMAGGTTNSNGAELTVGGVRLMDLAAPETELMLPRAHD